LIALVASEYRSAAKPQKKTKRQRANVKRQKRVARVVRVLHYSAVLGTMSVHIFFNMRERKAADEGKLRLRLRCPLVAVLLLLANPVWAGPQSGGVPGLQVTPNTTVVFVGDYSALSAVDETGRPVAKTQWSISPSIADLRVENGEVLVQGKQAGRAVLTATANNQSATSVISVVAGKKLEPGTVRWSLQPTPGFETLLVVQAQPSAGGPDFYSIEWSPSANAIVRALSAFGQQRWMTHLVSMANAAALKHTLPPPGQVLENDALVRNRSMFIIGEKNAFLATNASDPSSYGLPMDGKSILLHASPDGFGGMILLERGRFRDSLVDLKFADGSELWRYRSEGRLTNEWTVNHNGDVGIVESLASPPSSALLILHGQTGQIRFRIPFPVSSSTIDGYRCTEPQRNILKSLRPSLSGSVFTNTDDNMYVQVETHVESSLVEACKDKRYSFDDTLALLRVTPEGETDWKTFQHIHAEGEGSMVAQPRVFAGESIPDGFGGVLAAWTYVSPDNSGGKIRSEARLSRIGPSGQRDFTLPMPYWTKGLNSPFDVNMVLGDGNVLYAINGPQLVRFDTQAGEVNWVRHPPTGEVKLDFSSAGGGVWVSNAGRLVYFDAKGNGVPIPWTVAVSNLEDIGLVQTGLFERDKVEPLQLRELHFDGAGNSIAVEDGAPYGHGTLVYFNMR
jgi:outer membrane protein assembly factor BamB